MKRVALLATAVMCAAAPASIGLIGNASFSEDVPVRVPERAVVLDLQGATPAATRSQETEPGDDRGREGRRGHAVRTDGTAGISSGTAPTVPGTDDHGGDRRGDHHGSGAASDASGEARRMSDDPARDRAGDSHGGGGTGHGSEERSGQEDTSRSGSGSSDDRSSGGPGSSSSGSGGSGSGGSRSDD